MNQQAPTLPFDAVLPTQFSGETFVAEFDAERLTGQWQRVWQVMRSGQWRTLNEIQRLSFAAFGVHDSEAAISARLRDFRKPKFGGHTVERRRRGEPKSGLFEYRLKI